MSAVDPARRAALDLMDAVTGEGRLLSDIAPARLAGLAPADRARAQRLATEALRWSDRADRLLGPYLRRKPPLSAHNALRLGVWELCAAGEAPHGVVSSLVEIIGGDRRTERQRGLVNAVLRRVAEEGPATWPKLPLPRLPRPLRRRLTTAWGAEATQSMERAHAAGAPLDLTPRDGDADALARRLGGAALPTGSVRLASAPQITSLPGYETGEWWVQDAAAALPVRVAAPVPGETALDLCAAPGGKTLQLAAAGCSVTALDISAPRLRRLEENLARCGLEARIVTADALDWRDGEYDIVLLDAPCSATGTIRRHPDLPHARPDPDISPLLDLQARLIDRAVAALAPGGRLIYCVCSLLPEEGERQAERALDRHPSLRMTPIDLPGDAAWIDPAGGLRTRPDYWEETGGLDGFYVARFDRA